MKPTKAYILKTKTLLSEEYAKSCAVSCEKLGIQYEYFNWHHSIDGNDAWNSIGLKKKIARKNISNKAQLASSGHAAIWKKIADNKECAIILEHDAIMLHKVNLEIPDNKIVVLGYKSEEPQMYDYVMAGPPQRIVDINGHEGAHAYCITHVTAQNLIDEIENNGVMGAVDNIYFLRSRKTKVPIGIADPTPAIGWLRESTIWNQSSNKNYEFIPSFKKHFNNV